MQTTYNRSSPYGRLLTACHIYLTCQTECYINYNALGNKVFDWLLTEADKVELGKVRHFRASFQRVLGYESQVIGQHLGISAALVHEAFMEVISNEFNR